MIHNIPMSNKLAAFHYFINRLFIVPMSQENSEEQIRTIKYIATVNSYHTKIIHNLIQKRKFRNRRPPRDNQEKFTVVNYTPNLEHTLHSIFRKVAYRTNNSILKLLYQNNNT